MTAAAQGRAPGSPAATPVASVDSSPPSQPIPNLGVSITPTAPYDSTFEPLVPGLAAYPDWQAGQAVTTVVGPNGRYLLVLTSGYNRLYKNPVILNADDSEFDYPNSQEYVFIYRISNGPPVQTGVVTVPNTYNGIVFDPVAGQDGKSSGAFYVSSCSGDYPFDDTGTGTINYMHPGGDNIHVFSFLSGNAAQLTELELNHAAGLGLKGQSSGPTTANGQIFVQPCAAGLAISTDGLTMAVANYYNDSLTLFTGGLGNWTKVAPDIDLRPGDGTSAKMGTPGGEYPFWVVIQGTGKNATAFVSSVRDREIDVVSLGAAPKVTGRVPVTGEPLKMAMNKAQTRLYVAEDMTDTVDVIDISKGSATHGAGAILETIPVLAPATLLSSYPAIQKQTGANTNSVTLSPDETELYVTDGNLNAVAVVALSGKDKGDQVTGLIPTGWYPNSVSFGPTANSPHGNWVYVVNGKSPTGANPGECYGAAPPLYLKSYGVAGAHKNCLPSQEYNPQLIKAGLQSFPQPTAAELTALTAQVAVNNRFAATESDSDAAVMAAVRQGIQHVIFILKENRGYDQVLGDLEIGNGDPSLNEFGEAMTPNLHNLARTFVTLDDIMASSEVSNDGWPWSTSARAPDVIERQFPVYYAHRGVSLDSEGANRNVNVAIPTVAGRVAANPLTPADGNLLAGTADTAAPDGPDDVLDRGKGYLWDAARRAGLAVRDYGFFIDGTMYGCPAPPGGACIPPTLINPYSTRTKVAISTSETLAPFTDPYYRGFDNQFPDYYRFREWEREFDANYAVSGLPALSLVRLMHDHTGNFNDPGKFGLNTPELQQADNDYAVGLLIQKIANSVYKNNTLIFVIEDDSQDSGDHVDSHRTVAFVAGAYVKQHALVSTQYNTVNFLRTMEEVLGLAPMNLNDALSGPMADVFNTSPADWKFAATPSAYLYCSPALAPLLPAPKKPCPKLAHSAQYWARVTRGMDFSAEDRFDFAAYNRILWRGLMGSRPYPAHAGGQDLRQNRERLLTSYRQSQQ